MPTEVAVSAPVPLQDPSLQTEEGRIPEGYENKGGVYMTLVSVWEDERVLEVGDSDSYTTCV